ncbi:sulfotransferase [Luteimonas terricola]|uniref:Sulfotransferase n=1 Tax=Luteimonas terricola TaxID=645597 RepID=A0ABQ2EHZ1_9GAMM|nr:sulfotransferase [Luteimonas terricola]GGK12427.1 hypothetical protein GCM10011394_22070 [Luteimonas terricola]
MDRPDPPWAPHPDPAVEARLARADPAMLGALLADPALRNDPYARLRALDRMHGAAAPNPQVLGAWLQAMLLGNRPQRAWRVTGGWPIGAATPPDVQLLAAQVAQAVGRGDEARARFREVIGRHPHWVDALQKYAEFEAPGAMPDHAVQALERILAAGATDYDREKAGFALARAVAPRDPQRAFALAAAAQARKRGRIGPWDRAAFEARLAHDRSLAPLPDRGRPCSEVFIVGLPRSGTTLLASLLGAHPSIANVGEQGLLPALAADPPPARSGAHARDWYRAALADLADGAPVVVDKLPGNAEHAGHALARFPDALVVHLERGLDDCATSIHMHDFESGSAYACEGADLGHYAGAIASHLRGLRERSPTRVLHLRFEDLARAPEASLRPLLSRLGLDWDPSIPEFWRQDVQTATYSEAQVREPVHTRSIGSARRFLPASAIFLAAVRGAAAKWHHSVSRQPESPSP